MEAEWYSHGNAGSGSAVGYQWQSITDSNAYGEKVIQSLPNQLFAVTSDIENTSPHVGYEIDFQNVGTYYIWLKGRAETIANDSLYYGLDGVCQSSSDYIKLNIDSNITWLSETKYGRPTITISSTGEHIFDLWMREAGSEVDRIYLTTDANFDPALDEPPLGQGTGELLMDINGDGITNFEDFARMAENWLD